VELAALLFQQSLGVSNLSYVIFPDFRAAYLGLRQGDCDALMSAADLDLYRSSCLDSCPKVPPGGFSVDGSSNYSDASECCFDYSVPYSQSTGFAFATRKRRYAGSLWASINSGQVINAGMYILIAIPTVGWLLVLLESRVNEDLDTLAEGVYWATATMTTTGYGDIMAQTGVGRLVSILMMLFGLVGSGMFTSVLSAAITYKQINSLKAVDQLDTSRPVCTEPGYPGAVALASARGFTTVVMEAGACMRAVVNGDVQAFLDDIPVLQWHVRRMQTTDIIISDSIEQNPFAIVFAAGSPLRQWANTGILALRRMPRLAVQQDAINARYTFTPPYATNVDENVSWSLLAAVVVMYSVTGLSVLKPIRIHFKRILSKISLSPEMNPLLMSTPVYADDPEAVTRRLNSSASGGDSALKTVA
jgi:ABC-type amino acid transport substrate-binding protein